jgi:[citrate (pro-3S)-lyase] ligase
VGCAGLAANVIKCVAVNEQLRGENLSARLLAEVENAALERGHFHLFLCTRPCNRERFARSGFWPIAQSGNNAVLMENTPQGIERYCRSLRAKRKRGEHWRDSDERQSVHPRPPPSGGAGGAAVRCPASVRGA